MIKKWKILNSGSKGKEIVDILLTNRKIKGKKAAGEFFHPVHPSEISLSSLNISKTEVNKAIKRIKKAHEKKESVVVYTDYDTDGVSGGTIIWETLYSLGIKAMPYVPHRVDEGYGFSEKGIDIVKEKYNPKLIISVDHGVTAWEKVAFAKKLGIDIIIIDHHVLPDKLPEAVALVHTTQLAAAGLAWVFVNELIKFFESSKSSVLGSELLKMLDLAALATIADLVPLTGANRSMVKYGLEVLNHTKRLGLLALIAGSGLTLGEIGTYEVGHLLAPRINASGRLTHALDSLRLLCTKDKDRAKELADKLNLTNKERQLLLEETVLHAKDLYKGLPLPEQGEALSKKLIFLSHETYNQGVIGLVAGKLVDEYYLPSIVISRGEVYSKASARSISGFNIIETLRMAKDLLVDVGGHPMAAGFTVETKFLDKLEKRLQEIAGRSLTEENLVRELKIDTEISLSDITDDLYKKIQTFAPFGMANYEPVFVTRGVKVEDARLVGSDGKHLKLKVSQPSIKQSTINNQQSTAIIFFDCIAFGMGELYSKLTSTKPIDIAYTIDMNHWNGNYRLQLKLKDVKIIDSSYESNSGITKKISGFNRD
ncbi:MAG: Single-stranded-DNA-specific exonuclease RecJ [Candidatus Gottesmanbacteria bacterium GW2011_GWC2_39_8]|uniref:Single-stranded-DNA-specific exonuclease RecJ n=1 Tax=Candidatus Gottesmanbacteria bacterium GW2011_GWC2_39_8 TaxID=1618450 RepID=A0A0G0T6F9_9BACT|nr:MAG: Single-stranded-DNA-specific exonuclease RecJ [Candidatus Gottesmanbacteria bacterium GW2011_GWC2_39_8]